MYTTIKVSRIVRDKLKEQASRDGLSMGEHIGRLADAEERRRKQSPRTENALT